MSWKKKAGKECHGKRCLRDVLGEIFGLVSGRAAVQRPGDIIVSVKYLTDA